MSAAEFVGGLKFCLGECKMCTHQLSHCGKPVSWVCGEFFVLVCVHHIVLARKHLLCPTIVLSFPLQTAVEEGCCWSTWDLHSESLNCVQEKDKLPGNGPCKWPWFELLDELIGGSPKQSRIGSARKQARFLCSPPQPRPAGGVPTPYFRGGDLFLMGYLTLSF